MIDSKKKRYAIAFSESTITYALEKGQTVRMSTPEQGMAELVVEIEDIASDLILNDRVLFSMRRRPGEQLQAISSAPLGRRMLDAISLGFDDLNLYYGSLHELNPRVALFIECAKETGLDALRGFVRWYSGDAARQCVEQLNACAAMIRGKGQSAAFKAELNVFLRTSTNNSKRLVKYIDALFEQTSRLTWIRIDLSYRRGDRWDFGTQTPVTFAQAVADRERFFKAVKKIPNRPLKGFAWKLEYGLDKGLHYHVLLAFRGSDVHEHITIARMLGEHWSHVVTAGAGLYWNCNAHPDQYKYVGTGVIHCDDEEKRMGLEMAALYLTKPDYYVTFLRPHGARTFQTGIMPKPRKLGIGGRPRASEKMTKPKSALDVIKSVMNRGM